jgi:hypothetical protein
MLEILTRFTAVILLGLLLVAFGWYFSFGTDTLEHDWIYFGGGVLALLSGIATLGFGLVSLMGGIREWGVDGLVSDHGEGYEVSPASRGGGAAAAAASEDE